MKIDITWNKHKLEPIMTNKKDYPDYFYNLCKLLSVSDLDIFYKNDPFFLLKQGVYNFMDLGDPVSRLTYNGYHKYYYEDDPLVSISDYQAFFPARFYSLWEVLHRSEIDTTLNNFYFFDDSTNDFGHIEAVVKYMEMNAQYEHNKYLRLFNGDYKKHNNRLFGTYNIKHKKYKTFRGKYDFCISVNGLQCLDNLKVGGSLILEIDNILKLSSLTTVNHLVSCFETIKVCKSEVDHSLNCRVWVVCGNYGGNRNDNIDRSIYKWWTKLQNEFHSEYLDYIQLLESDRNTEFEINDSIKWCHKYNLSISPLYDPKEPEFEHKYLSYTLKKGKLSNNKIEDDGTYHLFDERLHTIKRDLNTVKRIIDTREQFIRSNHDIDVVDWNRVTDDVDIYKNVRKTVQWRYKSEMMSKAWLKMHEFIYREGVVPDVDELKAFHLCEAPGSFISSIHHYLKTHHPTTKYKWYAQSLNPKVSDDDESKLMSQNRDRWLYSLNDTGDITQEDTIRDYLNDPILQGIELITADGGLKVPPTLFNEQEAYLGHLHFSQVVCALLLLSKGGTLILKSFIPFAESMTISIIRLLTCVFDQVKVVKPVTSHPSSSEVYLICTGYKGCELDTRLWYLLNNYDISNSIVPTITKTYINDLVNCSRYFADQQIASIKRSLFFRHHLYVNTDYILDISRERFQKEEEWIELCQMKPLDQKLINDKKIYKKSKRRPKKYDKYAI